MPGVPPLMLGVGLLFPQRVEHGLIHRLGVSTNHTVRK